MNCDKIARWYRWLEYASCGRELERRRLHYLNAAPDARRALMLGEGDGRFLAAFVRGRANCAVDAIEISREMLRLAARRVSPAQRITFHQADARSFPFPAATYDLIFTHFFLDCFSTAEAADLISRIASAAAPCATWLISEFYQPDTGIAHYWTAWFIRLGYFFFRLTTGLETRRLPEYRAALQAHGFYRAHYQMARGGLLISELWQRDDLVS